jgi:dephospho-CoA kinase
VHELYAGEDVRAAVVERWGADVAPDGVVDRSAVARHAFAAPEERAWLEQLLWPLVGQRVVEWRRKVEERDPQPRAAVVETPLIAEEEVRAARAGARGHHAVDERSARQLSQEEKAARATYVVTNSGTVEELEAELSAVLEKLDQATT